ncbi:MAG: GDP-mannose 4,6-dehydratase [Candidatus Kerfeldbacteria bacterium]|nr:GDP-mannose 4,6-dehydratase [Candidatus Kerfeldbacteria bacterium]
MRRALITGINGFVGPHLRRELNHHGYDVFGIGKGFESNDRDFGVDITDRRSLRQVCVQVKPDVIFHLAGFSSVAKSWEMPDEAERVNVGGTVMLLDTVSDLRLKPRLLLVSSADVYGRPPELPIPENAKLAPVSPYGRSRVNQEKLVSTAHCPVIVARSFNHTGPGQTPTFAVPSYVYQAVRVTNGRQTRISVGDLSVVRDLCDVRDIVRAYRLLVEKGRPGEVYNVCSGLGFELRTVLQSILALLKIDDRVVVADPKLYRRTDIPALIGDPRKIKAEIGWQTAISFLDKTLPDIIHYWQYQEGL